MAEIGQPHRPCQLGQLAWPSTYQTTTFIFLYQGGRGVFKNMPPPPKNRSRNTVDSLIRHCIAVTAHLFKPVPGTKK